MKGAKILVEALINEGVDTVFGYPGGYAIDIFDELYQASDRIKQVLTCHEQGATHAADGYARATGKTGVVLATSGPGATNLVTGIATAYMDSIPLVAITGNVPLSFLGRDSFQEIDITGVTMPITKHNYIVKDVQDIASIVREAFYIANSGRPGPVLIDVPKNVQQADAEYVPLKRIQPEHKKADSDKITEALRLIDNSSRPLIYAGGGIVLSGAHEELRTFAELIDAPVSSSMMGLGAMPSEHRLFTGMIGMHGHAGVARLTEECDLLIALGARFSDRVAGDRARFAKNAKILHIDIDNAEINKNITAHAYVVGDLKLVLTELNKKAKKSKKEEWVAKAREYIEKYNINESVLPLNPRHILRSIKKASLDDRIIVTDVGQHQMWTAQTYRFNKPRTFLTSGGLGTMGFGMGASIGAALGSKKSVTLITGDGSFHMNFNEVVTASKEGLPISIFVFNNNTLGMVRQWQKLFYQKRFSSTTLDRPTNYELLAKGMGADYLEISKNDEVEAVVKKALDSKKPVIVNCKIFIDENVLPMIPPGKSAGDIILRLEE